LKASSAEEVTSLHDAGMNLLSSFPRDKLNHVIFHILFFEKNERKKENKINYESKSKAKHSKTKKK